VIVLLELMPVLRIEGAGRHMAHKARVPSQRLSDSTPAIAATTRPVGTFVSQTLRSGSSLDYPETFSF
jgi:hypothetical protein